MAVKTVKTESTAPTFPAPPGFMWVYNRLDRDYEVMFDHKPYVFGPYSYTLMTLAAGHFCVANSALKTDYSGIVPVSEYALAAQGDKTYGKPLPAKYDRGVESIDRSKQDNLTDRSTDVPTKALPTPID